MNDLMKIELFKNLQRFGNTIMSVEHFDEKLAYVWNENNPKCNMSLCSFLANKNNPFIYKKAEKIYIKSLEEKLEKKINLTFLSAAEPHEVDCIKFEVVRG